MAHVVVLLLDEHRHTWPRFGQASRHAGTSFAGDPGKLRYLGKKVPISGRCGPALCLACGVLKGPRLPTFEAHVSTGRSRSVVGLLELASEEEDLQKMPSLWKQPTATVQVAAANEAGQSSWTKLEIWIAGTRSPASTPSSPSTSTSSESEASSPSQCSHGSFDSEIQRRSGRELQEWLQGQLKVSLMSWLKTLHLPTKGTKQELIERILDVMGVANRELPRRHDH
ncbi:unnamed protein product [Effrenium voratum]|nr:unnamed protein product [Effrenium voratum]